MNLKLNFENKPKCFKETLRESLYIVNITEEEVVALENKISKYNHTTVIASKQEQKDNFIKTFGIEPDSILAYGLIETPPRKFLESFINYKIIRNRIPSLLNEKVTPIVETKSYDCFNKFDDTPSKANVITHEDIESSWNCLIRKYKVLDNILIFKINKNEKN